MSDPSVPMPEWDPAGDTPPPLPPVGTRLDPLAGASPFQQAQEPAQTAARTPAKVPPAGAGVDLDAALQEAIRDEFPNGSGSARREFSSRRVADVVELVVDGAIYRCSPSAPADPLVAAVEAQESKNQYLLIVAIRRLVSSVMYPEDRERYEARLSGVATETVAGVSTDLPPIDPIDMIAHGLWLVGVYFARPTAPSVPSGAGR